MARRGLVLLTLGVLSLLLLLPHVAAEAAEEEAAVAKGGEMEDEDEWEDFDDEEVEAARIISSKGLGSAVKALPQLNDQNADRILNSTEHVLLLGYASWCKQSAAVMVDFAEAAAVLAAMGSSAVLAKLDAISNQATAKRFGIRGYPTIVFAEDGTWESYTAGQTREDIVNWVQKKTGRPATTFTSIAEAEELQGRNATVIVGLFEKFEGPEYEEFIKASVETVDVEFLQTTSAEAATIFSAEFSCTGPALGIWKSEPEKFVKYGGELKSADIVTFIAWNKHPLVTKLHARNMGKIYGSPMKKQVILFANSEDFESLYPLFLALANDFKGELFFLWVDIEDEQFSKPMTTAYGISDGEPVVVGFDNGNGSRYMLEAEVTSKSLKAFAIKFKEGRLKLHFKSEHVPKQIKGENLKIVVGKTFEKSVLRSSKDVLLLVYTPYCYDCESLIKAFGKLAKHFKGVSSIVFAKFNAAANEHPSLEIDNYPKVLLYRASAKNSPPLEAPSKLTLKKLVHYVNENHIKALSCSEDSTDECKPPLDSEVSRPPKSQGSDPQKGEDISAEAALAEDDVSKTSKIQTEIEQQPSDLKTLHDVSSPEMAGEHDEL